MRKGQAMIDFNNVVRYILKRSLISKKISIAHFFLSHFLLFINFFAFKNIKGRGSNASKLPRGICNMTFGLPAAANTYKKEK